MKIFTNTTDIKPESKFDLDSVLFFDIESTGLSREYSNVYLIGCAYRKDGKWMITQFLSETLSEEEDIIRAFFQLAGQFHTLVHFNGDSFDVPYIDYKAEQYGMSFRLVSMDNYDILKKARQARPVLGLKNMSQKSVERFLKIKRDDEMSGGELIPYYYSYQQSGDEHLEHYLLLHNYDDMQGMLKISPIVNYADIAEGKFLISGVEKNQAQVTFNVALSSCLPQAFEKQGAHYLLAGNDDFMQLVVDAYCGTACHYFEDYKNYYYLPAEDRAVHKDVAQFVDKQHRVKATRKNCYVKKESVYLPQTEPLFAPEFRLPEQKKGSLFEAALIDGADTDTLKQYVMGFIGQKES